MSQGRLVMVVGGARSGKSQFAEKYVLERAATAHYLACCEAHDAEMTERIALHRRQRGAAFITIEEPLAIKEVMAAVAPEPALLWDCLTLWLANKLHLGTAPGAILEELGHIIAFLRTRYPLVVVVSNEVGLGLVPETPLGRQFRDLAGRSHQSLAKEADEVYGGLMGLMLRLKPGAVC